MHWAPSALIAAAAGAGGLFIASHHPLWPEAATVSFLACWVLAWRHPRAWLVVVPAVLPAMSLAPWTGWITVDEFDLVVLGALAGGRLDLALDALREKPAPVRPEGPDASSVLELIWISLGVVALARGLGASGGAFGWFDTETDPLNAWRVFKGPFFAWLAVPLLGRELLEHGPEAVVARLGAGMLAGSVVVVGASLWERAAYPGFFDFSSDYRIVALFWEMHVGGAAIDAYLAMAVPFAAWAVVRAQTPVRGVAAAVLAVLLEYVCLTTFSRGLYVAAPASLVVFAALRRRGGTPAASPRCRAARRALVLVLALEALAIVSSDSFMVSRVKQAPHDLGARLAHWGRGIGLLQGVSPWSLGLGLGRLPAGYAAAVPDHELPGEARLAVEGRNAYVSLRGPAHDAALAGSHALTQRVPGGPSAYERVELEARADRPTRIGVSVCEIHLLYERACRREVLTVTEPGWQRLSVPLPDGARCDPVWPPRGTVFGITVLEAGGRLDIDDVRLEHAGASVLRNGDFAQGLAGWFPSAQHDFLPWHVDSLPLELLIEQGIAGLATFVLLFVSALRRALAPRNRGLAATPVLVGSVSAVLLIGMVSSVLDVPRVAFLLFLLAFIALHCGEPPRAGPAS